MAGFEGRIRVKIGANITELDNGLKAAQKSLTKFSKQINDIGKNFSVAFTAPLSLIGIAAVTASNKIKDALNDVAVGTGATGEVLEGLKDDFRAVAGQVPNDLSQSAKAIADLNTMLGASGKPLQEMALAVLNVSRITKSDLGSNISSVTKLMNNWGIQSARFSEMLDKLLVASQNTGVSIDAIASGITSTGGALREAGFSIEQSMALFGQLDKAGMNSAQIINGLQIAVKNLAKTGVKDFATAFNEIFSSIKNDTNFNSAVNQAVEVFGKSGVAWAEALRSGRFEIDELTNTINDTTDAVRVFTDETATFQDKINVMKNQLSLALEPLGNHIIKIALEYMPELSDATGKLSIDFSDATIKAGLLVAGLGPLILVLGSVTAAISSLISAIRILIGFLSGPLGLVIALGAAAVGLGSYFQSLQDAKNESEKTASVINYLGESFDNVSTEALQGQLINLQNELTNTRIEAAKTMQEILALSSKRASERAGIFGGNALGELVKADKDNKIKENTLTEAIEKIQNELNKRSEDTNKNPVKTLAPSIKTLAGTKGGGKSSKSSRVGGNIKSPIDEFVQTSQDKIKYLNADGGEFLDKLKELQSKTKILSDDWKKLEDFRLNIDDKAFNDKIQSIQDKIKYLNENGADYLPELKKLSEEYDLLSDKGKRLFDTIKSIEDNAYSEKWSGYAWEFSEGLMKAGEYANLLKNELANLDVNSDKWREKFTEYQNIQSSEIQKTIQALNENLENGTINGDLYKTALQSIIEEFSEFPKIAQAATDALETFNKQTQNAEISLNTQLSNSLKDAQKNFQGLIGDGIIETCSAFTQAVVYGENFGEALSKIGEKIVAATLQMLALAAAMKIVNSLTGGIFGGYTTPNIDYTIGAGMLMYPNAKFASGGIVNKPTLFPMSGGLGLMGEVPGQSEAVMPLTRDNQGRLGVYANAQNTAPTVIVNIENKSSQPVDASQGITTFDEQFNRAVVQVLLRDQATNGPISRNYRR